MEKERASEIKQHREESHAHPHRHRVRSWVRRDSRMTNAQMQAFRDCYSAYAMQPSDFQQIMLTPFNPVVEIGFGNGESLFALAKNNPQQFFIGIETHKPGVGSLLARVSRDKLTNVRVVLGDVVDIFAQQIPDDALAGVQIFFPDPWPKRRHFPRRLIQKEFVSLCAQKLRRAGGYLHIATDWEDYAIHITKVMADAELALLFDDVSDELRSSYRPLVTKFESRALREGRAIRDFKYVRR